jgi:hypothetical protein
MRALTRRRVHDRQSEHWLIFDDRIEIGCDGRRAGVPVHVNQWQWTISFYPPSHRGVRAEGTATDFATARKEQAWRRIAPEITEADGLEHLRRNAHIAWKHKMWDTHCPLPTQVADGRSRCYCGAEITIANVDSHIDAEHMA